MNQPKNRLSISFTDQSLCTRCGTCVGLCPQFALSIGRDLYPEIDRTRCNHCGKCMSVCPGGEVVFRKLLPKHASRYNGFDGFTLDAFVGHANSAMIRHAGASGGVVTALLWSLLERKEIDGCLVTRMIPDQPWLAEPFIAKSFNELTQSQGSRYTIIPLNAILNQIRNQPGYYSIAALPCHAHGLRKAMRTDKVLKNRIHSIIGLFCGGALEPYLITEMLQSKKISSHEISDFQFRGGDWPGKIRAILKNDRRIVNFHYSNYKDGGYNYFVGMYMPQRCQTCIDGSNILADISVGDAWTKDFSGKYKFHAHSRLMVRTAIGETILNKAQDFGYLSSSNVSNDPSYHTHRLQTKRKGVIAPIRIQRLMAGHKQVPQYDRRRIEATAKERLTERLVSFGLRLCLYKAVRYPILKWITSKFAIPFIKLRIFLKNRKYQRRPI